ncbi:MAG: transketolase [Candidatus Schekmanbacteria bacterium]|nr:transketolase [Candidatus Schekmanbacteria bacterium]
MIIAPDLISKLDKTARQLRIDVLKALANAGSGHTGGSLSAIEIITALYFNKMRHNPQNPQWEERDMFVLSKGHGAPAWYAALARCGYFPVEELQNLRKIDSRLQGHPYSRTTPGVEVSSGSLGQGLSIANGLALSHRLDGKTGKIYVLMGDGEMQEGQIWEAAMSAGHYKLDNICAIIDNNGLQIDGAVCNIMNVEPLDEKWRAFGWQVFKVNGHNFAELIQALNAASSVKGKPSLIIAQTVKGKGVSFMENKVQYHGMAPTSQELERALAELEGIN